MEQQFDRIFADTVRHTVKHFITAQLIFHQRVSLTISLQADTLTELGIPTITVNPEDLEQMAQDMGVDLSGAKNNRERAELIAAAEAEEGGEVLPELGAGDIVQ